MNILKTLENSRPNTPYTSPVKFKVVAQGTEQVSKIGKPYCTFGVADATGSKKLILHDMEKKRNFQDGKSLMIRNYTVVNDAIMVGSTTKVSKIGDIDVSEVSKTYHIPTNSTNENTERSKNFAGRNHDQLERADC